MTTPVKGVEAETFSLEQIQEILSHDDVITAYAERRYEALFPGRRFADLGFVGNSEAKRNARLDLSIVAECLARADECEPLGDLFTAQLQDQPDNREDVCP